MTLFFDLAFSPAMGVFTFLMSIVLLYWLIFILGIVDLDFIDMDMDLDIEAEGDFDSGDMGVDGGGGVMVAFLGFFYFGKIPVTLLVTLLVSSMWFIAMTANYYLNQSGDFLPGALIGVVTFIVSLFVVKVIGYPIGLIFEALHSDADEKKTIVGGLCKVITAVVSSEMGQVEMINEKT